MNGWKRLLLPLMFLGIAAALAMQLSTIRQLRMEVADLRDQLALPMNPASDASSNTRIIPVVHQSSADGRRLADLESAVEELTRVSDHLKRRGQIPPGEAEIAAARITFMDSNQPDRERLRALRLLRRHDALTDDLAIQAIAWLQSAADAGTQRALLRELGGMDDPSLKQPLLTLAASENSDVREEALDNLRRFMDDPQVEALLWNALRNDPDNGVRRHAERALERGPFSETRVASLQQHALNPQTPLAERLLALRALNRADADTAPVNAALAQLAQNTTDPETKLRLFRTFDGMDDPVFRLPLVNALQDPNPFIREEAVDALSSFRSDETVREWLEYVANNDPDPEVRREAFDALGRN